ncbi:unnamed protein product [Adineta ricciae]|uniref:G-protein coupled receptors family 1 profile domain-containing protein n=1 Tax=Adineta ricciae TaxID=249248 RepID=A0A815AHI5_ADIRI|nr:unnamed protein product [Adineta ricciae]CAF1254693.1 unnamed protein product [Adineta ricciae]
MSLLISIPHYMSIYIGIPLYTFGFLGNLINITVLFSKRNNPCTFLLIYASIIDCFVLNIGLLPRIQAVGFNTDSTLMNLPWCKIRSYGLRVTSLTSIHIVSLMSIERFFVSCRTAHWRDMSNLKWIRCVAFLITFVFVFESLPFLILTEILRSATSISCTPMYNAIFARYASFFGIPAFYGVIPLSIMIIMSILIYYKLRTRTHLRKAQRSLTLIILVRIIIVLVSCGPYAVYFIYSAIVMLTVSGKSSERIAIENCILGVVSTFLYVTYSPSFFIYYSISSSYRKQVLYVLRYVYKRRRNAIQPA